MIRREKSLLQNGAPSGRMLRGVLEEHERDIGRMNKLHDYYALRGPINQRTRPEGLPNNRLSHAYARYVVSVAAGYLTGSPVSYQDEEQEEALRPLIAAYRAADVQSADMELARAQSLFGKGGGAGLRGRKRDAPLCGARPAHGLRGLRYHRRRKAAVRRVAQGGDG